MPLYRKRSVVVAAEQWNPGDLLSAGNVVGWLQEGGATFRVNPDKTLTIQTIVGDMKARAGDFIVKGAEGGFFPCRANVFAKHYEGCECASTAPTYPIYRSTRHLPSCSLYIEPSQNGGNMKKSTKTTHGTIDRVEDSGIAVVEIESGEKFLDLPMYLFYPGAKDGDKVAIIVAETEDEGDVLRAASAELLGEGGIR